MPSTLPTALSVSSSCFAVSLLQAGMRMYAIARSERCSVAGIAHVPLETFATLIGSRTSSTSSRAPPVRTTDSLSGVPGSPISFSASSYALRPRTSSPLTPTISSPGCTPARSAGPPINGATTMSLSPSPTVTSTPAPPPAEAPAVARCIACIRSGSRNRVNGSLSSASILRIAAYVSSRSNIVSLLRNFSLVFSQLFPANDLSTYALSTARHASRNNSCSSVTAAAGCGHGVSAMTVLAIRDATPRFSAQGIAEGTDVALEAGVHPYTSDWARARAHSGLRA
mmetsp:Transcript_984/g.2690  ORF Transcript_984/g.2690 Transcript_984/m.2690 type:complete len:283 (-) Transcript_984:51-899(-)